ncbi:UvrB/UvrC motif-containing protein [Candidatus Latescibacterota bacterium]
MKCQICNENEANIVFTQIVNNEKLVMQICSECAKKKGLTLDIKTESHSPVESLVGSLTGGTDEKGDEEIPDLNCEVCDLSFAEFKKSGLFGCDQCHLSFGSHIKGLLKQIHGVAEHEGKGPRPLTEDVSTKKEIKDLKSQLKKLVEAEEYEKAAELRDRINDMEKEHKKP